MDSRIPAPKDSRFEPRPSSVTFFPNLSSSHLGGDTATCWCWLMARPSFRKFAYNYLSKLGASHHVTRSSVIFCTMMLSHWHQSCSSSKKEPRGDGPSCLYSYVHTLLIDHAFSNKTRNVRIDEYFFIVPIISPYIFRWECACFIAGTALAYRTTSVLSPPQARRFAMLLFISLLIGAIFQFGVAMK